MYRRAKLQGGVADAYSITDDIANIPGFFGTPPASGSFAADFSLATENPLSQSGRWLNGATDGLDWTDFQDTGAVACAAAFSSTSPPPYNDAIAILKTAAFACNADQYAEATVHVAPGYNPVGTHELGLFVRGTLTAHSMIAYEAYRGMGASHAVVYWPGPLNSFTPLGFPGTPPVPQDGDIIRLEAQGTTIRYLVNSVLITSVTDSNIATGQPGMQSFVVSGGTLASHSLSSFRCGNL